MLIRLVAPGQPPSAKNGKRGFIVPGTSRVNVVANKTVLAWYAKQVPELRRQFAAYGIAPVREFVRIDVHCYLRDPVLAGPSPDGDNSQSAAWDALTKAGVIVDDKYCVEWGGSRRQDPNPRVEIEVRTLPGWVE